MKPDTTNAMNLLIRQVRENIPFDMPVADLCTGGCRGCPKKLIEFLDMQLEDWEQRLDDGEKPSLGDLHKLSRVSKKVYKSLERNNLVGPFPGDDAGDASSF